MTHHDKELDDKAVTDTAVDDSDAPCPQRRRLLGMLGVGLAAAYVAPTLFSVGQAEAGYRYNKRPSYSRPSYSKYSGYDYRGRERKRLREYRKDPVLILEDVILGPPRR